MERDGGQAANSERFLAAYRAIETVLRRRVDTSAYVGFRALVHEAARKEPAVRRYEIDLRQYGDLRNAIVHEDRGGEPIAEPHLNVVDDLERIAALLSDPPKIGAHFAKPVVTAAADQRVGLAARTMYDGRFSQLPVYASEGFLGLLTAETVMRWVAAHLTDDVGLLEEQPVADVLRYAEDPENHVFMSRDKTIFEALEAFERFSRDGKSLDAIIVTHSGRQSESPLGIVTIFDFPRLLDLT
jgi:CBS domain-containing protein